MRPNAVIDAISEGNMPGQKMKMTIDASATEHLMSVLTDLYSDRIGAFIREYATNAYDAHLDAGVTRPIEVTLPNRMSQYYRIKDFGTGLDVSDMERIYTKYGASTKRDSDTFNGMLGLGCKSAMTYAAQYSIVSVKDGIKYSTSVTRGADGVGELTVIDSYPTTEPNGVEVVIPIKSSDLWDVAGKVANFFQWWPEGSVLVDGKAPKRFEGREVAPGIFMVDGLEKDYIVMGNVAYPLPDDTYIWEVPTDRYGYSRRSFSVVYFAKMGEVTFAPSREALQTTKNTMACIEKARSVFKDKMKETLQAEVDLCESHNLAMSRVRDFKARYRDVDFGDFTYKGEVVPSRDGWSAPFTDKVRLDRNGKPVPNAGKVREYEHFNVYDAHGGSSAVQRTEISIDDVVGNTNHKAFIVNAPKSLTTHHKTKMRRAFDAGELGKNYLFLTHLPVKPGGKWTDNIPVIDWSVIRDYKMDANTTTTDREKHTVFSADGQNEFRTIPLDEKIVYVSPTYFNRDNYYGPKIPVYRKFLNSAGYSLVLLGANRHAKFAREHKDAHTLIAAVAQIVGKYESGLTDADKALLSLDSYDHQKLVALAQSKVDIADPAMVEWVKKADEKRFSELHNARNEHEIKARACGAKISEIKGNEPFKDYPLISALGTREIKAHGKHVAQYIEAVYNNKKGN